MLGTLIQGRVSLVGAVTNAEKLALLIAIRYAHERKQFGNPNGEEQKIIDYPLHQSRLYPRLASLYAQIGMHQSLVDSFDEVFSNPDVDPDTVSKLETDAAAAKALSTWNALETIQIAREACGGQGFLSENRLVELRKDLDVYATFEGDNNVLLQLVAKRLLSDYASKMKHPSFKDLTEYASYKIVEGLHIGNLVGLLKDFAANISHKNKDMTLDKSDALIAKYVYLLTEDIANKFNSLKKKGLSSEEAFLSSQPQIVNLGKAYAKHLQVEGINKLIQESETLQNKEVLKTLKEILILEELKSNSLAYLRFGLLGIGELDKLTEYEMELFAEISRHDIDLVESFAIPEKLIRAKIAQGAERTRNAL
jgi:acyl-CoA oxidase